MRKIKMHDGEEIDPANEGPFIFVPELYYSAMFFVPFPAELSRYHKGGNICSLLFNDPAEPREWCLKLRFRQYKDDRSFGSDDERSWYRLLFHDVDEAAARTKAEEAMRVASVSAIVFGVAPLKVEVYELKGTGQRALELLSTRPPYWMSTETQIQVSE